jgi:hypothetical protein
VVLAARRDSRGRRPRWRGARRREEVEPGVGPWEDRWVEFSTQVTVVGF